MAEWTDGEMWGHPRFAGAFARPARFFEVTSSWAMNSRAVNSRPQRIWRHLASFGFLAVAAQAFLGGQPALAQGVVKAKHGDWELRCETPPGAQSEQCALLQSVAAEDKPNINLVVIVLKTADGKSRLLRVIAPLGVLLPSGLGLKIDATDVGRAGFVRCLPTGCVAEVVMDEKLIDQMKTGKNATFIIFQTPEEGIGIPLALNGFKQGFESLP
ncbi:invasion associated locus B family protein [Beijerinckia indica]|uniref:Invasion associated locus B family protein n=1 Tax=Beijerinckia indica subsp. indica (strain ATCC 9039 / DSM 1715 / NCIMB 8712) TaxID=395963 RepID=B2IGJ9_BEII9|nr:invasion associated locus B family protein [Beijerinckia indica]ACB94381.1 Invasion associated locus B family protein [Beijerinckia indica subsp. indica ATCC 9039]